MEKLFRPAWQFVAAKSELPKDGDFLTFDLFGRPILIRNSSGGFLAYENICSHRHCLLTNDSCGNQPTLRCKYHGWEYDCDSNWKVPAENTLESYHVTALHQKFFGDALPPEKNMQHLLEQRYTGLTFDATSKLEQLQARLNRWLGNKPTLKYVHRHIHPNTVLVSTDTINYALMYMPTSPTTVRIRMRFFAICGTRRGPIANLISWLAWRIARAKTLQIHNEDRSIYASQQKGLERSRHPGVIGSREERIYYFQKYILEALGMPLSPDPANVADVAR